MATRVRYGPRPQPAPQRPPQDERPANVVPAAPRPVGPPFPVAIPLAIIFVILVMLSIILEYLSASYDFLTNNHYLLIPTALVFAVFALYTAYGHSDRHKSDFRKQVRLATLSTVGILLGGTVAGIVTFSVLEPYHDWSYSAELNCDGSCIADIPVPMRSSDTNSTFFNETSASTKGQGYIEIVREQLVEGEFPALRVHWSGKFVVSAKGSKDYRDLAIGKKGMYDSNDKEFLAIGKQVPSGANASIHVSFDHKYFSQAPRSDHWAIQGPLVQGENDYPPAKH